MVTDDRREGCRERHPRPGTKNLQRTIVSLNRIAPTYPHHIRLQEAPRSRLSSIPQTTPLSASIISSVSIPHAFYRVCTSLLVSSSRSSPHNTHASWLTTLTGRLTEQASLIPHTPHVIATLCFASPSPIPLLGIREPSSVKSLG